MIVGFSPELLHDTDQTISFDYDVCDRRLASPHSSHCSDYLMNEMKGANYDEFVKMNPRKRGVVRTLLTLSFVKEND